MKKITLKELAKLLNMSISTVSRSLSDHPDISIETKRKVKEASALYNYAPNLRARYLRTKSSGLIALILPEYNMFFIPELMKGVSEVVNAANYSLLVFQSDNSFEKELDIIDYCTQISVDGILLSVGHGFSVQEALFETTNSAPPIVLIDKVWVNNKISSVGIDDADISFRAVDFLYSLGHKYIGGVFGDTDLPITQNRLRGFEAGISALKGKLQGKPLIINDLQDTENALKEYLEENKDLSALYIMSDELMLLVHYHLLKLGYRIPEDISLVSISDGNLPYLLHPNITHFYHSGGKVGKVAAETLIRHLNSSSHPVESIRVDCQLKQLESVKQMVL